MQTDALRPLQSNEKLEFKQLIQGTQFSHCTSIEEVAQAQFALYITDRSDFPPRPHSLDLPFRTMEEAQKSMQRFEAATSVFVEATTARYAALDPAWARARMRHPSRPHMAGVRLQEIAPHHGMTNQQLPSWANSLPFGTNVRGAYKTNCYGYACNKAKFQQSPTMGHSLNPGEVAGMTYFDPNAPALPDRAHFAELDLPARSATFNNVLKKALADGLSLEPIPGGYPVYFALAPDDHH